MSKTVGLAATFPAALVADRPMSAALVTRSGWSSSHCHSGPLFGPEFVGCHQVAVAAWVAEGWWAAMPGLAAAVAASKPSPLMMMAADFMALPLFLYVVISCWQSPSWFLAAWI